MLTVIGSGMTNYSLENVFDRLNPEDYDCIFMDSRYCDNSRNQFFINNRDNIFHGNFSEIKDELFNRIKTNRKAKCLYIVTGSPLFYSGSGVIIKYISDNLTNFCVDCLDKDIKIIDGQSSLSYMLSKMGIDSAKVETLSMHGRSRMDISSVFRRNYTFILCDKHSLGRIKEAFKYLQTDNYSITIGSRLGYDDEKIFKIANISTYLNNNDVESLTPYVLLLERHFMPSMNITSDDEFLRDRGMITKAFKRGITLSELELKPNMIMWDVGAGSGSVSVDAYKLYRVKTLLFEKNEKRVSDIRKNLERHNVIESEVIEGDVIDTSKNITEYPDRIFIGGGGEHVSQNIMYFVNKLNDNGIILINYVTLDYIHNIINILRENNIIFNIKALSLTTFKDRDILISEPERLMFQIKIYKGRVENNG